MDRRKVLAGLAAASAALAHSAGWAQDKPVPVGEAQDFPSCDGYGTPTNDTDAMSRGSTGWIARGPDNRQLRREELDYGGEGIEPCTRALASPLLLEGYRLRRASLLQARALHRLAVGEGEAGALADLDLAEQAAAGSDALAQRSFGVGLQLVRAFARLRAGDARAAAAGAEAVMAARPYEPQLALAAARLHMAASNDWPAYVRHLRQIARVDPHVIVSLFAWALTRGEFEQAVALYPQVRLSEPSRPEGGYAMPQRDAVIAANLVTRAEMAGAAAFARETLGRPAEADATLAAARLALTRALRPPPTPSGTRGPSVADRNQHRALLARQGHAEAALARWERAVQARRMVRENRIDALVAELAARPIETDFAALDIFQAMVAARPALQGELGAPIDRLRRELARQAADATLLPVRELARRLPEPESVQRMPTYDGGGRGLLGFDADGYRTQPGPGPDLLTVRFASGRGSTSMAGEMVLLRAAELARRDGHRDLLLVGRRSVVRTTTTQYGYGIPSAPIPSGQEAEIDILFVDPDNLPEAHRDAGWRVLDAEAVWTALSPIYVRPREERRR